ncbi:hypothetical protein HYW75_02230 [Candidatus Pacearchaeota archaeon]|nr:hypothetical protein [Candidatus Pacearchaeota archaeon]
MSRCPVVTDEKNPSTMRLNAIRGDFRALDIGGRKNKMVLYWDYGIKVILWVLWLIFMVGCIFLIIYKIRWKLKWQDVLWHILWAIDFILIGIIGCKIFPELFS